MQCFSCDYEGTRRGLGSHYGCKPDHRPKLSDKQHQIITGLLMGDGHINRSSTTPRLRAEMVNEDYLHYLDDEFPHISCGVNLSRTAKQQSKKHIETGFNQNASQESYSDCYWWETMCHDGLQTYADWYKSGEKVFPEDLELTPMVLKHWYVCDGSFNGYIQIYLDNEKSNKKKIESYFSNIIYDNIRWDEQKGHTAINFTKEDSNKIFEYIGGPLPGFRYKWSERFK